MKPLALKPFRYYYPYNAVIVGLNRREWSSNTAADMAKWAKMRDYPIKTSVTSDLQHTIVHFENIAQCAEFRKRFHEYVES